MYKRRPAVAIIELSAAVVALGTVLAIAVASTSRARELSKRMVCNVNLKGIGATCRIYAMYHQGRWPIPPHDGRVVADEGDGIEYLSWSGDDRCHWPTGNGGGVAFRRHKPSYSIDPGASTQLSVTRAYWMLVRSASITTNQFICPSGDDEKDPTEDIELYYDFECYQNISYGYQVPFGPPATQPHEGMDCRQAVAADKGPWYDIISTANDWVGGVTGAVRLSDSPEAWRPYNSINHGGRGNGEGQNILFADGHATFYRVPTAGIDHDNIYTVIDFDWGREEYYNLIHGILPNEYAPSPYPGQYALGDCANCYASTDSLIYP